MGVVKAPRIRGAQQVIIVAMGNAFREIMFAVTMARTGQLLRVGAARIAGALAVRTRQHLYVSELVLER